MYNNIVYTSIYMHSINVGKIRREKVGLRFLNNQKIVILKKKQNKKF